jgi:hypothetical protein
MVDDSRLGYLEASVEQQNVNFDRLYQHTLRVDQKIEHLDDTLDRKFDDLRLELSKHFRWTVGLMVTTMGLMVTLIGLVAGLLSTAQR